MHGKAISIWFFIGTLLTIYGVLIMGAGFGEIANPPEHPVVLAHLHAAVWWGGLTLAMGIAYVVKFRPGRD